MGLPFDEPRPSEDEQPGKAEEHEDQRQVVLQFLAVLLVAPGIRDFRPERTRPLREYGDARRPVARIERRREQAQKLVGLTHPDAGVDLAHQAVCPAACLDRRETGGLKFIQLLCQFLAPLRRSGRFRRIRGRRRAKRLDLTLNRVDPFGVGSLGGGEPRPPVHDLLAQVFQRFRRDPVDGQCFFRTLGRVFPRRIVRCLRLLLRHRHGRQENGREPRQDAKAQDEEQGANGPHQSTKALGIARGAASSHSGTGSPLA